MSTTVKFSYRINKKNYPVLQLGGKDLANWIEINGEWIGLEEGKKYDLFISKRTKKKMLGLIKSHYYAIFARNKETNKISVVKFNTEVSLENFEKILEVSQKKFDSYKKGGK